MRLYPSAFCIVCMILIALALACCDKSNGTAKHPPPKSAAGVKAASGKIGKANDDIVAQADWIVKKVPETKPHTDQIVGDTDIIAAQLVSLAELTQQIQAEDKQLADAAAKLEKSQARVKELENEHNSLLRVMLALLGTGSVIGVVVSVWLIRDIRWTCFFASLFVASMTAEILLHWAIWFAIGVAVLLAAATVYLFVIRHMTFAEVAAKANDLGEDLHSPKAKALVKTLRDRFDKTFKKAAAVPTLLNGKPVLRM